MKTLKTTIIMILSTVALSTFAQNNNTAASSSNAQKKDSATVKTVNIAKSEVPDSGETQVKNGLKEFGKGVGKVAKREWKTLGKTTQKIGTSGKQFVQKLGKTISDSFQKDSTATKKSAK